MELINRIENARWECGGKATKIFLGRQEWALLREEARRAGVDMVSPTDAAWTTGFRITGDPELARTEFRGLKVFQVDAYTHFTVA